MKRKLTIHISSEAESRELRAAEDLLSDISLLKSCDCHIAEDSRYDGPGGHIFVGHQTCFSEWNLEEGSLFPPDSPCSAPGGAVVRVLGPDRLLLGGFDGEGTQRAVYSFTLNELGVDPFAFWTGNFPEKTSFPEISRIKEREIPAPLVAIRCYKGSEYDELANLSEPYLEIDFPLWKEMIDSLVRVGYNALDIYDQLGRTEFITRVPYLRIRPGYQADVELVNRIIDYAREKGMLIQVSFSLGWHFKTISDEASYDWTHHREEWIETWCYYLKETPIGRADIFLNQPRHQKLDHPYSSSSGENTAEVFNEVFPVMRDIIREHNPGALIVADLSREGVDVYQEGFRPLPAEDFIISWPDDGYGVMDREPEDECPYRRGTSMHAGYWYNHLVQDPYPFILEKSMKMALLEKGMNSYNQVTGQTFRHFTMNMEGLARLCQNPAEFDGRTFMAEWIERYFSPERTNAIGEVLSLLHEGQEGGYGYIRVMSDISRWQSTFLMERKCVGEYWEKRRDSCRRRIAVLEEAHEKVTALEEKIQRNQVFFHDHFILPVKLLLQLNRIFMAMLEFPESENKVRDCLEINNMIEEHTVTRKEGDRDERWTGWYNPETSRPNGGYLKKEFWRNYH